MKILIVIVCTGTSRNSEGLRYLKALHAALRDGWERHYLVIDNALPPETNEAMAPDTTLIGGDNSLREFSGFDRLFRHLGNRLQEFDLVNVVTEMLDADYKHYLGLFTPGMLALVAEHNFALGHLDSYPEDITLLGGRSRAWIRTCYFYMTSQALQALGTFVTANGSEPLFSEDPLHPFDPQAVISHNYQQYLLRWLTGGGEGVDDIDVYRKSVPLTAETFEGFKFKALSILNEHGLSIRLRKLNVPTIDVEWLYDTLLQPLPWRINWRVSVDAQLGYLVNRRERLGIPRP